MKSRSVLLIILMFFLLTGCNLITKVESVTIIGQEAIDVNQKVSFSVVVNQVNSNKEVIWSSSDDSIVTIDEDGVVTGISVGIATIRATSKDNPNISDTIDIIVKEPIIESIVLSGQSQVYVNNTISVVVSIYPSHASQDVIFSSDNEEIATVDEFGIVIGISSGTVKITATSTSDVSMKQDILITVREVILDTITISGDSNVKVAHQIELLARINNVVSTHVTWASMDEEIATVDEDGIVRGVSAGTVIITVTSNNNPTISADITIHVTEVVLDTIAIVGDSEVNVNQQIKLTAMINSVESNQVTWSTSDSTIATIDEVGNVQGLKSGTVIITATYINDITVIDQITIQVIELLDTITITGGVSKLKINNHVKLKAMMNNVDITSIVIWSTNDNSIATINSLGNVTAISEGVVTIRAEYILNTEIFVEYQIEIITPIYEYYHTKVLLIDRTFRTLELLDCPASTYSSNTIFVVRNGNEMRNGTINDLYVGMENIYVQIDSEINVITKIIIDGETGFSNIRVAIRSSLADISKDETLYHDNIVFYLHTSVRLQTFDGSDQIQLPSGATISISLSNSNIIVKNGSTTVFISEKRIIFIPNSQDDGIQINSISRNSNNRYSGNLEVLRVQSRLLLINDIDLEKYLYKVVPSEMPASYHIEALKAQAIAARTYAFRDIFNRTTERFGYTVDDSIKSQVYNNINAQSSTTSAVNATKGIVMKNNGELVSAFYYSTSSGLTASAHEVWITNGLSYPQPTPYLIGQNLTTDALGNTIEFNYQDEANMLEFFKTINVQTPDNTVGFHRWRTTFTKAQLTTTINKNMKLMYASNNSLILTEVSYGWASIAIPDDIGQVENIYVLERGTSGVVMSLAVQTTTGTYKIVTQYNIRFTVRPTDAGVSNFVANASSNYSQTSNNSILFSGFFAIETTGDSFIFYGGGNGHGVGMSQNGANGLANTGSSYDEILTTYYSAIDLIDMSYIYHAIVDFKDFF